MRRPAAPHDPENRRGHPWQGGPELYERSKLINPNHYERTDMTDIASLRRSRKKSECRNFRPAVLGLGADPHALLVPARCGGYRRPTALDVALVACSVRYLETYREEA